MESSRRAVESYWRSRMIDTATADDDKITPIYRLDEICDTIRSSPIGIVKEMSEFIFKRLDHKSPRVKQKALRLIKYSVAKAGVEFKREMQRHSGAIRQLFHYRGEPDALRGDSLNKAVRDTAHEAVTAIFASDEKQTTAEDINKRIQGFGNTNFEMPLDDRKSFLSEVVGFGSASIKQGLSMIGGQSSGYLDGQNNSAGSYKGPSLRKSLTSERDSFARHQREEPWTEPQFSASEHRELPSNQDYTVLTSNVSNNSSGSNQTRGNGREERLLDTITAAGGVRLQPSRETIQNFLAMASKLDSTSLSQALNVKIQSHVWQSYDVSAGPRNIGNQIFSVDTLERNASKGHGIVTCMSAGNNAIVVGTNKGWLLRYDFGGGDSYELDLSVSRTGDQHVHRVFVDPGGRHCLAVLLGTGGAETYYTHAKWRKPRMLSKLKGLVINAVAWNRQQITEASTRDIILGTEGGQLYETVIEEKDKKEKHLKLLFELTELREPFASLQMETIGTGTTTRYYVMAVTTTRLYSFTGMGSLEALFAAYSDRIVHFTELPGEMPNSEIHFFYKQRRAEHFAWLSGAGIYYGNLYLGSSQSNSGHGDDNFVENKALFEYSKLEKDQELTKPQSLVLSEFHFLLLCDNKVKVVNRVNQKVREELQFDHDFDSISGGILGLCSDATAGVFYAYDENSIFEISVHDEGQDMWQVYLELKEYAAALEHCKNALQRDQVYLAQAEAAFSTKDFMRAASFYAKTNYILSFEEIALKFVAVGEQDALRTFLLRKLDNLGREDRSQITMISTWATELYLDKINRLLLDDDKQAGVVPSSSDENNTEYQNILREFRDFLSDCKDVVDEATTVKLLGSYGRVDELVFFASLKEQHETVIHHYIQQGEARKALELLQKPNVSPELQYKFAPDLIMLDPYETVEAWMVANNLNPRRLIPALMRYSSEPRTKDETHEAIKYLEFCVQRLQNEDSAVHNLLLSLYTKQGDESALLRFLQCKYGKGRPGRPDIFYDPKYALRLCLKEGRMRACVYIYSMMGMHEEAVALALQVDPELAMAEADKVEDDEDLRKKLWLMVAKHVIEQEKGAKRENIRKAIAFLKETDGLLKIEDILPFFPDFALIDDFKEAICSSLEDYNKQIEGLKQEMNDATHGADNIRNDISALAQRYAIVDSNEECGVCGRKILASSGHGMARGFASPMAPFYVFPCEHTFHAQCLIGHVTKHTDPAEAERILDLQRRLSLLVNSGTSFAVERMSNVADEEASASNRTPTDQIRAQLDDAVAGECPFCGDLMIKEISLPFISPDETELLMSWEVKAGPLPREYGLA